MKRGMGLTSEIPYALNFKNHLLTIGIDNYAHFPKLYNAVKDVRDFSSLLVKKFQFEEENIISLIDKDATENNIYDTFKFLIEKINRTDNLIIYFSGHGHYDETLKDGYWIPVDAEPESNGDFISNYIIANFLRQFNGHHIFLIADSCFSGTLISQNRSSRRINKAELHPSCRIFTSGRNEVVLDGSPGENSPFARCLLDALSTHEGLHLSCTQLIEKVKSEIIETADQTPINGRLKDSKDDNGEFIFWAKNTEQEIWSYRINKTDLTSLKEYINLFPKGRYVEEALSLVGEIEEEGIFNKAKNSRKRRALLSYMAKYPRGRFAEEAKVILEKLETELKERQKYAEQLAIRQKEIEKARSNYKRLIEEAETFFKNQNFKAARDKYWQGLNQYYQEDESFVPSRQYVEGQIGRTNKAILFQEFFKDGKKAYFSGRYKVALNYLNKAKELRKTDEVAKLIEACEKYLQKNEISISEEFEKRKLKLKIRPQESRDSSNTPTITTRNINRPTRLPQNEPKGREDRATTIIHRPNRKTKSTSQHFRRTLFLLAVILVTFLLIMMCSLNNDTGISKTGTPTEVIPSNSTIVTPKKEWVQIGGNKVMMSSNPTTIAGKRVLLKEIKKNTTVEVLDKRLIDDGERALQIDRTTSFYPENDGPVKEFHHGKAVTLVSKNPPDNPGYYVVDIEYGAGRIVRGLISSQNLSLIGKNTWYQIRYQHSIGWVIGKYIDIPENDNQ